MKTLKFCYLWISRDGEHMDLRKTTGDRFHNLVNYIFTELSMYNPKCFQIYHATIVHLCSERGLSISDILTEGARPYTDKDGHTKIWDEDTNTEKFCGRA